MEIQSQNTPIIPPKIGDNLENILPQQIKPLGPNAMGIGMGLMGFIVGMAIAVTTNNTTWQLFPVGSTLGGGICGWLFWKLLVSKKGEPSLKRSLLAGALAGSLSHPLCWYILAMANFLYFHLVPGSGSNISIPLNPITALWGVLPFSLYSLIFVGWSTIGAGLLMGYIFHRKALRP